VLSREGWIGGRRRSAVECGEGNAAEADKRKGGHPLRSAGEETGEGTVGTGRESGWGSAPELVRVPSQSPMTACQVCHSPNRAAWHGPHICSMRLPCTPQDFKDSSVS